MRREVEQKARVIVELKEIVELRDLRPDSKINKELIVLN